MKPKAFVLLSGGIDSSTCLAIANLEFHDIEAVSVYYGQRHRKEIEYAHRQTKMYGVPHHILDLSSIVPKTMLTNPEEKVPNISYDQIEGVSPTYVPFRNGLMLSALASFVAGHYSNAFADETRISDAGDWQNGHPVEWGLYAGFHAEDARNWAYPDCTPEFAGAMANAIFVGTYRTVRLHTPLQWMNKAQVIIQGNDLGVNWAQTWSCYTGEDKHCGVCPTCRSRREGFLMADIKDPTEYAADPT